MVIRAVAFMEASRQHYKPPPSDNGRQPKAHIYNRARTGRPLTESTEVHHTTILKPLVLAGEMCERIIAERVRNVQVRDIEYCGAPDSRGHLHIDCGTI